MQMIQSFLLFFVTLVTSIVFAAPVALKMSAQSRSFLSTSINGSTCLVDAGKIHSCWGPAFYVPTGLTAISQLSMGRNHACALSASKVLCWGDPLHGKTNVPADLAPATFVVVSEDASCAVLEDKTVRCWGNQTNLLFEMPQLTDVDDLHISNHGGCTLSRGRVLCWNLMSPKRYPQTLTNIQALTMSGDTACVATSGLVRCGQYGAEIPANSAKKVRRLFAPKGQVYGEEFVCALFNDTSFECNVRWVPKGLKNVSSVGVGPSHVCVILASEVRCWGETRFGQTILPLKIQNAEIRITGDALCYRSSAGQSCWTNSMAPSWDLPQELASRNVAFLTATYGRGYCGVIEDRIICYMRGQRSEFTLARNFGKLTSFIAGEFSVCVLNQYGQHQCFGNDDFLLQLDRQGRYKQVVVRDRTANKICTLDILGRVRCPRDQESVPKGLVNITQIAASRAHACALNARGVLTCWKDADAGEDAARVPAHLGKVRKVITGDLHTCVLTEMGEVRCWGRGSNGPIKVPHDLGVVKDLAGGEFQVCATTEKGLRCWYDGEISTHERKFLN